MHILLCMVWHGGGPISSKGLTAVFHRLVVVFHSFDGCGGAKIIVHLLSESTVESNRFETWWNRNSCGANPPGSNMLFRVVTYKGFCCSSGCSLSFMGFQSRRPGSKSGTTVWELRMGFHSTRLWGLQVKSLQTTNRLVWYVKDLLPQKCVLWFFVFQGEIYIRTAILWLSLKQVFEAPFT